MITRIKNANCAKKYNLEVVKSKITLQIAEILKKEGFIESYQYSSNKSDNYIFIKLKYKGLQQIPYIRNLSIISKPGSRVYVNKNNIPRILGGIGVAILSTSQGLLVDRIARLNKIGGELLFYIW